MRVETTLKQYSVNLRASAAEQPAALYMSGLIVTWAALFHWRPRELLHRPCDRQPIRNSATFPARSALERSNRTYNLPGELHARP